MKRFAGFILVVLAVPAFARVVSYAPYTTRVATPSHQERASRHFVLIESEAENFSGRTRDDVVLYDSSGIDEPRVITPKEGVRYEQAALYQKPGGAPVILAIGWNFSNGQRSIHVGDGTTWREVNLGVAPSFAPTIDVDTGGPFTHGLYAPIVIGNETWPFVATFGTGVFAIDRNGVTKTVVNTPGSRVVGRNLAGDRFLVIYAGALWSTAVDGPATRLAVVDAVAAYAGWITSNGSAYVQMFRSEGRFLFKTNGSSLDFIAGPYDSFPPAVGSPQVTRPTMRFFAVPTADFEGAWMIQRETGKPTTMLKHSSAGGLQTLWSDVSGPQVEALIVGPSGNTVLIQVHRERDGAELSRPFIDPALAVWRVGQDAPRSYDELYLNESWNKGFVHIDVDQLEAGDPFVFNSGWQETTPPVSRVSPPIAGGGDVIQEWGVVRGSLKQRLVLPGVARLPGAFGSFWMTDVNVYNPLNESQQVEVKFTPLGTTDSLSTTLTLEPNEIRAIGDALKALFNIESGGGSLHFLPAVGINATARTYSRKGEGTFGFGMQAIDYFNAAGPRFPLSFAGAFPGENFRTNLLLTDTSGRGTSAKLEAFGLTGWSFGNSMVEAPAAGTVQMNSVGPAVGLHSRDGGGLVIEATRGTAIATVVAIDNRTNDPTYFPPDLPGAIPRAIPVIGHLDGANGSKFRSDIYLYNPNDHARTVMLSARKWDGTGVANANFTLLPNESRVIPDALKTLFGMEGLARLRYSTNEWEPGQGVRVTSRTYTVEPSGATYGCLVPPLNSFQIGTFGDRLEILGAGAGPGFRTNIGLVDLNDNSQREATVRITIIAERRILDTMTVRVPMRGGMQINDVFKARGLATPAAALIVVDIIDGQQIAAYATLTDNVTNDSTYLSANLGAQPEN
ncbi:MAG TPA: hypothetical protein VNI54_17695 [Thermoanaerobaculia bacterium]|nr:hypothetical protein [Thermoanaerobaculia bacterium]